VKKGEMRRFICS